MIYCSPNWLLNVLVLDSPLEELYSRLMAPCLFAFVTTGLSTGRFQTNLKTWTVDQCSETSETRQPREGSACTKFPPSQPPPCRFTHILFRRGLWKYHYDLESISRCDPSQCFLFRQSFASTPKQRLGFPAFYHNVGLTSIRRKPGVEFKSVLKVLSGNAMTMNRLATSCIDKTAILEA